MAAVTICSDLGAQKIKSVNLSIVPWSICHEVMGPDAVILVFWMLNFQPTFSLSSFIFHFHFSGDAKESQIQLQIWNWG